MKLFNTIYKDRLLLKADEKNSEKYKMQPESLKNLVVLLPEIEFRIYPNTIKAEIKNKIDANELKPLMLLESPKFLGITIEREGYYSFCEMIFEPVSYYSNDGKFIEVKK